MADPTKRLNGVSLVRGPVGALPSNKNIKKLAPIEDVPNLSPEEFNANKRELSASLRFSNSSTLEAAPWAFWDVEGALKTTLIDDSNVIQQLSIAESGVNYSARRYNDLKILGQKLTHELKAKLDHLDEQKKVYQQLHALRQSQTEEGQRMNQLQRDISIVEEEIARKIHYTRQLDHVLERLRRNQIKFEAHMTGMEETVKSLDKEGLEIKMLRNSLHASLSKAKTSHEQTIARLAVARKERDVLLEQRRGEVKNAISLQEWIKRREEAKIAMALELRGDLTQDEELFLKDQINEKVEKTKDLQRATEESLRRLQALEDAEDKLKQATAVSSSESSEEMREKFRTQLEVKRALENEVKEAEARLSSVKAANQHAEDLFQDLKSSGGGLAELSREAINKLEASIEQAKNDHRVVRAGLERLSTVLLGLNQGSRGLLQRVQPFISLADGGVFELTQTDEELPWADTLEALSTAEQVLAKMLDTINGEGGALGLGLGGMMQSGFDDDDESQQGKKMSDSLESLEHVPAISNNIRVISVKILKESDSLLDPTESSYDDNNRVQSGKDVSALQDEEFDNEAILQGTTSAGGTATTGEGFEPFLENYPTRATVKKNSQRIVSEARRKGEYEIRKKRSQDRLAGKSGPDDVGGAIDRLNTQRTMAQRLSTTHHLATLPDGVALSDDAMTKANAFLTKPLELQ